MHAPGRHFLIAIVVAVFVGQTGLAAHAATHAGLEAADCEICVSQGDSPTLASEPAGEPVSPTSNEAPGLAPVVAIPARATCLLRSRGPPAIA